MKKLFYLIILGAGIIGCTTDSDTLNDLDNAQEMNFTIEDSEFTVTTYDYYNRGGKLQGSIHVTQDCDNLYVQFTGEPDEVYLGVFNEDENPEVNQNNGKIKHAELPDDLDSADEDYQWTFPLSDFNTETLKIFARSWGNWAGDETFEDASYLTYVPEACEEVCGYGYGYWKTHGPDSPGNQDYMWPVEEDETLMLGGDNYTTDELLDILNAPVQGDELISLMHHLITAKFNRMIGVDASEIASVISLADEVLEADGEGWTTDEINSVKDQLEAWNEANSCEDESEM